MYQINMLKGRQLPEDHWVGIVLTGIAFLIPVVLAFAISIGYFNDKSNLSDQQEKLTDYEFQIREMEGAKTRVDSVVSEIHKVSASLSDVGEVLARHTQWTDILMAISDNLPDTLQVNKLDVKCRTVTRTVDQRYGDKKKINISIPARTLVISLYSVSGEGDDAAVRDLQRSLIESESFQRCVKDVVIAAREPDNVDGKDVVRYELNCVLKIDEF